MKFEDYITAPNNRAFAKLPPSIQDLNNIILYGAVDKYAEAITLISRYSPSKLKYEKRIDIIHDKDPYYIKISDIHYEVDMSLLGCNSKQLWNELYTQILDIICLKPVKMGIILCKYFNETQQDLLDNFYSYMQKSIVDAVSVKFILLCDHISFIPENIRNCCHIISFGGAAIPIYNHKHYEIVSNKIVNEMLNKDTLNLLRFRESIYDIFSYNLCMNRCIWNIIEILVRDGHLEEKDMPHILFTLFQFLKLYQNNYRPISHVEGFLYQVVSRLRVAGPATVAR